MMRSSTRPSTYCAVVVDVADVVGTEPPDAVLVGSERLAREVGEAEVAVGDRRAAQQDASLLVELDLGAGQGPAVVDAPARGLAHAVGRDEVHPGPLGSRAQPGRHRGATDEHGIERSQGVGATGVVEQADHLGGHETGVPAGARGQPFGGCDERLGPEAVGEVHREGRRPGIQRSHQHLEAGDVVGRDREQPLAGAAEGGVGGAGAGSQGRCREHRSLGGARGAGGADDDRQRLGERGRVVVGDRRDRSGGGVRHDRPVAGQGLSQQGQQVEAGGPGRHCECFDGGCAVVVVAGHRCSPRQSWAAGG